jgi:hypothetical protein
MSKLFFILLGIITVCSRIFAQGVLSPHAYMQEAVIEHHGTTATVKADSPIPLKQAVTAVSEEYGWAVHYEDPPYQTKYDVMDMTNPSYRAAHPEAKVVLGPAGGPFQSTYSEDPNMWSSAAMEQQVLEKIVADYNQSGNPGNFVLRRLSDGSFDVVGNSIRNDNGAPVPVTPVLDTPIYIPLQARSLDGALTSVLSALSAKTGFGMNVGNGPSNLLGSPWSGITVGGVTAPARNLLMVAIAPTKIFVWDLRYGPQDREYALNLRPVTRVQYDTFGHNR